MGDLKYPPQEKKKSKQTDNMRHAMASGPSNNACILWELSKLNYVLLISTLGNVAFSIATCTVKTKLSCTVGSLTPATTYYVKVQAVANGNVSAFSNIVIITTNTSSKSQILYKPYLPIDT